MSAFSAAAQKALFGVISSLAGGRVYDDAPADVAFPWIEIGDRQSIPDDTGTATGSDAGMSDFFDLHIWSRAAGKKETADLVDQLHGLLHGASLSVDGRAGALAWIQTVRIIGDPDGITRHGIVSVEIIHRSS